MKTSRPPFPLPRHHDQEYDLRGFNTVYAFSLCAVTAKDQHVPRAQSHSSKAKLIMSTDSPPTIISDFLHFNTIWIQWILKMKETQSLDDISFLFNNHSVSHWSHRQRSWKSPLFISTLVIYSVGLDVQCSWQDGMQHDTWFSSAQRLAGCRRPQWRITLDIHKCVDFMEGLLDIISDL